MTLKVHWPALLATFTHIYAGDGKMMGNCKKSRRYVVLALLETAEVYNATR